MDTNEFLKRIATGLKSRLYPMPMEQFKNSVSEGYGLRFFIGDTGKAFRLNFDSKNASLLNLESIDIWNGTSHDPNTNIQVDNLQDSALPLLADNLIKNINEPQYEKIELNPSEADGDETTHLSVRQGGNDEEYGKTQAEKEISNNSERTPYKESLKDLRSLVVALVKGVSNALFVFGQGGTGKTQSVEKTLHDLGLSDGDGYFQVAGTASVPVIYQSLYNNRDGIVLFDDCDAVLKEEDGRNIIKGATDTKKIRKISYLKKSSWLFNPAKEEVPEEQLGIEKFPNSFQFEGRIIFISNLQLDKLDPDGSIRTRALIIGINPTNEELTTFMEEILDDIKLEGGLELDHEKRMEALNLIKNSKRQDDLSLRKLVRTMNMAASGIPDWQNLALLYA